jgi:hypothetical protein
MIGKLGPTCANPKDAKKLSSLKGLIGHVYKCERRGPALTAVAAQPEEANEGADVGVHEAEALHCQPLHRVKAHSPLRMLSA